MSSFGPSDQQIATDEQARRIPDAILQLDKLSELTRDELTAQLEGEILRNEKLAQEVKELREEKVKLSLILEEEDERRANLFLKKVEELEAAIGSCPRCSLIPAAVLLKNSIKPGTAHVVRSQSMSSLPERPEE